eukprot:Skav207259  [mRNA]  locus=scaffold2560:171155:171457:+ [translate_table: standard]
MLVSLDHGTGSLAAAPTHFAYACSFLARTTALQATQRTLQAVCTPPDPVADIVISALRSTYAFDIRAIRSAILWDE